MNAIKKAGVCGLLTGAMVSALLSGCGQQKKADRTAEAITVNNETVNMGAAEFYLRYQQAETTTMLVNYGMLQEGASFWDSQYAAATSSAEAMTYGDNMKDSVKDSIVEAVVLRQHFGDYDLTFPEDLEKKASEAAAQTMAANADALAEIGTTEEDVKEVLELMAYRPLMFDAVTADTDTEVSDEEAAQTTITYARASLKTTDSETNEQVDIDDEQKGVLHTELETFLEQLKEKDDPEADMNAMAGEIDGDNIFAFTRSYGSDDTSVPDEVKAAVEKLEDGQVSDEVIDTGDYYYIVRLDKKFDEEKTEQQKETIVAQRLQDAFTEQLESWKESSEITEGKAWTELEVTDVHAYVQTVPEAESTSVSAAEESTSEPAAAESVSESAAAESVSGSAAAESTSESAAAESTSESAAAESTSVSAAE